MKHQNQSIIEIKVISGQDVGINCKNGDLVLLKEKLDEVTLKQEKILEILDHMQKKCRT